MREDDLRDVFGALHAGNDPDLGFDVTDVVRAGERVRRRRRTAAAVGSGLATIAAAVVAIVLLPGGQSPAPVEPAHPDVRWTTTELVPSSTSPSVSEEPYTTPSDVLPSARPQDEPDKRSSPIVPDGQPRSGPS
ncbi:MAG: hypothetical protein ABIQ18_13345 [Umezawaea sp.]